LSSQKREFQNFLQTMSYGSVLQSILQSAYFYLDRGWPMAEKPQETKAQNGGGAAEALGRPAAQAARSAGQAAQETAQRGAEAMERGGGRGAHGVRRASEVGGEMVRHTADAGAESMRHLSAAAGEAMQRGAQAAAEGQRNIVRRAAEQWEEMGTRMAMALQESARDVRALLMPGFGDGSMEEVRESVTGLVEGVLRTNMRMVEELFRRTSPANVIDLQRRFGAEYLDTMLQSSAIMLRAARRATEDALRPLEERVEQRRRREQERPEGGPAGQHELAGRVADVMETDVRIASPEDTVQRAAQLMREADAGVLPVGEGDRLVGMVTDRDVAVRLVAEGRDPRQTRVREVMTPEVRYVFEDEDLDHVAENMAEQQVRRLPVVNREKRLVGVISLADLARKGRGHLAARAYGGITRQGGQHTQAAE
jgi:CBS domain-containing protein